MKKAFLLLILLLAACAPVPVLPTTDALPSPTAPPTSTPILQTRTFAPTWTDIVTLTPALEASLTPLATPSLPPANPLLVHFIDVGQGDSVLIQTLNGQNILIDGGDANTGVVAYLQAFGVQRIDLMIATSPNANHIGGLVQVLQAFQVAKVASNGQLTATSIYSEFLNAIAAAQASFIVVKRGDVLSQDGLDLHILSPLDTTNPDQNENSIVLQFIYGTTSFLLMGDAGNATEADLLTYGLLSKVTVLKVGQHASSFATSPAFLTVVSPNVAVYTAGEGNIAGDPFPGTLSALLTAGAALYGTDQNGTIIFTVSSDGYSVATMR